MLWVLDFHLEQEQLVFVLLTVPAITQEQGQHRETCFSLPCTSHALLSKLWSTAIHEPRMANQYIALNIKYTAYIGYFKMSPSDTIDYKNN
jgi:hypothetical protein